MKTLLISLVIIGLFFLGKHLYMQPKFMIGTDAPQFEATLKNGNPFNLHQTTNNNIILLDFWGSWCGPCREESPKLVKLYNKYHGKSFSNFNNFHIVSIGIETNKDAWEEAIIKDKLMWEYHIIQSDQFASPITKQYGIHEIPTNYMINSKNMIMGVNMTYEEMDKFLEKELSTK